MEKSEFPAVLILSAIRDRYDGTFSAVVFADNKPLENEQDIYGRQAFYAALEARGGLPYEYTVPDVADVTDAIADIRAGLEAQISEMVKQGVAGDAESPATDAEVPAQGLAKDDTTGSITGQADVDVVVMVVRYEGTGQMVIPTGPYDGATDELVEYHDSYSGRPPDRNVKIIRDWLELQGFRPAYPEWQWLDRGAGPRRRQEVYRRQRVESGPVYTEVIDRKFLQEMYLQAAPAPLPEAERLAMFRTKALAGEGVFSACRDCPLVRDCPHGWGACDRKAALARAAMTEACRPASNKNPRFAAYQY